MLAKFKLVYNRLDRLNSDGKALVQIEAYFNRQRKYYSTKIYAKPDEWDNESKKLTKKHSNYIYYNLILSQKINELTNFVLDLERNNERFSFDQLDYIFIDRDTQPETFNKFFINEINNNNSLQKHTLAAHKRTWEILNDFNNSIEFEKLDYKLINDFNEYLHGKGFAINTIAKHHKHIKKYLNLAMNSDSNLFEKIKNPYIKFKVKKQDSKRVNLDYEEIERIENIDYTHSPNLNYDRDLFLFSIYTGLRYTHVMSIIYRYLTESPEGLMLDVEKVLKDGKPVFMPLGIVWSGKGEKIIRKYLEINKDPEDRVFRYRPNSKVNESLKIIAHDAKINKNLSFHYARHTFGTNLADRTGDTFLIMDLMGLKKIDTAKIYIHASKERTLKKVKSIDW